MLLSTVSVEAAILPIMKGNWKANDDVALPRSYQMQTCPNQHPIQNRN